MKIKEIYQRITAMKLLMLKVYKIVPPKVFDRTGLVSNNQEIEKLLKQGFSHIRIQEGTQNNFYKKPINVTVKEFRLPKFILKPGANPSFFLEKNGKLTHAVINGFLLDLSKPIENQKFGNALIFK